MNKLIIHKIQSNSEKDSDYSEYLSSIKKTFKEIPWINKIEGLYSEIYFLYLDSKFVAGVTLFEKCPEDIKITEKADNLFGNFVFASCLYVKPEYRNKGYGYKLLKKAILDTVSRGAKFIGIVDNTNQKLIDSYKKNFLVKIVAINSKISFIEFIK